MSISTSILKRTLCAPLKRFVFALRGDAPLWLVGGAVRDILLGQVPTDIDLLTTRSSKETLSLATKYGLTLAWRHAAEKHGILRLVAPAHKACIDVKLLAVPNVQANEDALQMALKADLMRRDLTINAMALPIRENLTLDTCDLIDFGGGRADLQNNIIRPNGSLVDRLEEDPLRVLRIARFLTLGERWQLCDTDPRKLQEFLPQLLACSAERRRIEIERALLAPCAHRLVECLGAWDALATLNAPKSIVQSSLQSAVGLLRSHQEHLTTLDARLTLLWFGLIAELEDGSHEPLDDILKGLLFNHAVCTRVTKLVAALKSPFCSLYGANLARFWLQLGEALREGFLQLITSLKCSRYFEKEAINSFLRRSKRLLVEGPIPTRQSLPVNGHTLQRSLHVLPGPEVKVLLDEVLVYAMVNKFITDKDRLLKFARRKIRYLKQT